jgi:cytoskeletal protein CcmA (bactofilin family)
MVFRRDSKTDSFQRQMSAVRQQIGGDEEAERRPAPRETRFEAGRPPVSDRQNDVDQASPVYGFGDFANAITPNQSESGVMEPEPPVLPDVPVIDSQTTVIAHDTVWKGDIQSNGTVHVHGRFEGAITAKNDVYVAEEADVDATITATNVVIAGKTGGTVRCENRFEVLPSGRVTGSIVAPTLVVHEGAQVSGQLRMSAPEPAETKLTPVVQRRVTT